MSYLCDMCGEPRTHNPCPSCGWNEDADLSLGWDWEDTPVKGVCRICGEPTNGEIAHYECMVDLCL